MRDLTIVTSTCGYGQYLADWSRSIAALTQKPAAIRIVTHGSPDDRIDGERAATFLRSRGLDVQHEHALDRLDFGTARNRAVEMASTEWVMHLDADDMIMPHALGDIAALAPTADVVALGYERSGDLASGPRNRTRIYSDTTGQETLDAAAPASGVSPFRRAFWERSPYRTDMRGAWDTALWIGFARLGARFRATRRPCFWYRQHADSIFNRRRLATDWTRALTESQLVSLRRGDSGVAVIVPLDDAPDEDRQRAWAFVRDWYGTYFRDWPVIEGFSSARRWVKGDAIRDALARCTADTLVIADADCVTDVTTLAEAVGLVHSRRVPWAVPHDLVHRYDARSTERLLAADFTSAPTLTRPPYRGFAGGGLLIVPRAAFEATGGIPSAFVGWGAEDEALAVILDTLLGAHWRGSAGLIHLWHAAQPTKPGEIVELFGPGNRRTLRELAAAAKRGEGDLWRVLRALTRGVRARGRKTVEEMAQRKRENSYLVRRGARG